MIHPEGMERRKGHVLKHIIYVSLGPNDCWHIHGQDKLKPFNFAMHGYIDGCSSKILWLEVDKSNHSPKIIASYFMELLTSWKACPWTDCGTENVLLAAMLCVLRINHTDELSSLTILVWKNLFFTEFNTKIHWNARLATSDVFHMFTQWIKFF